MSDPVSIPEPEPEEAPHSADEVAEVESGTDSRPSSAVKITKTYGGDEGLTLSEAQSVLSSVPAKVVLVAGEAEAGKTTLLVQIWAQFLDGPFENWSYANSKTLKAFDDRHWLSRASSGAAVATTKRTLDQDPRFLHLQIGKEIERRTFLLSDLRGEHFENIRNGSPARLEIGIAPRADRVILVVDGRRLITTPERKSAMLDARQLLGGLTEAGALRDRVPLLILASKSDLLDAGAASKVAEDLDALAAFATSRGAVATSRVISARPENGTARPDGLADVFNWLLEEATTSGREPRLVNDPSDRAYSWRRD